jgi:hypothetical protein|nr:MAG TPA: Glucosyl transferase GtrII [Caudoviricetes sp.]
MTAVLDYGEIMSKKRLTEKKEQNARLVYSDLSLKQGFKKFLLNPMYIFPVLISTILCYAYYLAHETVTIDSLSSDRYYHGLLVAQGRLTATIIENYLGFEHLPIAVENIIGLICFILGATVFCIIFDKAKPQSNVLPYTFSTCLYITFPLMNEYFMFKGSVLTTGGSILLVSFALYFALKIKNLIASILISSIFIFFAYSWYESFILVYIGAVFLLLILLADGQKSQKELFFNGFWLAPTLFLGFSLEEIISNAIINICNITQDNNNAVGTAWLTSSATLKSFFYDFIYSFVSKIFCYAPFTILFIFLAIAFGLMILQTKSTKKPILVFFYFGLALTVFFLSIYRGAESAYRTEQGIPFYIGAITLLLSSKIINLNGKKALKIIASLSLVIILTVQICSSNYWYHVNVLRDKEEKQVVCNIAKDLEKYDKNKPVIFIGYYQLSNNIKDKYTVKKDSVAGKIIDYTSKKAKKSYTYTACQTSISSYISWSIYSFSSANVELKKFFNSCGYDFKLGTNEQFEEATKKYINIPSYNDSGYILDAGDYIVVKVGNYSPNFYEFLYE